MPQTRNKKSTTTKNTLKQSKKDKNTSKHHKHMEYNNDFLRWCQKRLAREKFEPSQSESCDWGKIPSY